MSKPETNGEEPLINPEVREEISEHFGPEDPMWTEYAGSGRGGGEEGEKIDVTSEWIGEKGDWRPKTILTADQIVAMSQVRLMGETFKELRGIEDSLNSLVENMETYAVSHMGTSREQHVEVLKAMLSGEMGEQREASNAILSAFAMQTQQDE